MYTEDEIKAFNYVSAEPMRKFSAISLDAVEEIIPAHIGIRFIFDNGSIEVLKKILKETQGK